MVYAVYPFYGMNWNECNPFKIAHLLSIRQMIISHEGFVRMFPKKQSRRRQNDTNTKTYSDKRITDEMEIQS